MIELDLSEWLACVLKNYIGPHADEIIDGVREYEGRIVELEVKLAKAVEALAELATDEHPKGWIAIAAYNELKGQK